jgi:hypothetical protein
MAESTRYYNDFKTLRAAVWREFGKFPTVVIYPSIVEDHLIYFYQDEEHVATWDTTREAGYILPE